ncbi:MAG TPA: hypothetical protein PL101_03070 [Bacteroidales bacterium]|jgi:hypothetical protein|nr:hypothetical protein [Bacteroidales bacterium]HQK70077.1 hypothetical protein [Bacteroidales bacterium]
MENILSFRFGKDGYGSVLLSLIMAIILISCSKSANVPENYKSRASRGFMEE